MPNKSSSLPKYLRILIPLFLLAAWFAAGAIGGPYFGKIGDVASNDQSTFLPASTESTKVASELEKFQDSSSIPAIIVFDNDGATISSKAIGIITEKTAPLKDLSGATGEVSPPVISEDGKAAFVVANMDSEADYKEFSQAIREELNQANLPLSYAVTGPVGFLNDLGKAFAGIDGLLLAVALAVVFIILLIVYRSPILPFLVLINSVFALCASILIVYYLAKFGVVTLNGQVQGILFILVIGAATDYALLFVARYKEELQKHAEPYKALLASWRRSIEPIVAAGGTVIAGLLCLLLSDLTSNKALGPVGAIGIALAIIATLTLLPSLLLMWGRKVFWPRIPHYQKNHTAEEPKQGIWSKVATFVRTHTRTVWVTTAALLIICSFGILQLKASGIPQSEFVLGTSEARDGQAIIDSHFPGGSGTPAYVIVPSNKIDAALDALEANQGVASVSARADNSPSGSMPLGKAATAYPFKDASIKTVNDEALLEVTLQDAADSDAALATIEQLRVDLQVIDSDIRIGGTAAVQLDTRTSSEHDRAVVIPAVLIVITIILMFLLRSILAPLILLATTMVSFTATLGIAAVVFNGAFGFPGADPSVVLYGFIFLVALGIDYNIFLMTRVREESLKHGTRKGTLRGLIATGGVITSAGIVLSATFAALAVIPILFLVQLAFIVSLGVLIDTIIVRSLLVPALSYEIGNAIWWPSKKFKK
ncbi:MAG: MMPL family transporter [Candidatus Microsaccharimonas sp.]